MAGMANTSASYLTGDCIAPFLDAARFPTAGGYIDGRFCAPLDAASDSPTCCLPCPITDWTYAGNVSTYTTVAEWLSVVGLILMVFMLLSYLALPTQKTRSHYLSVCLVVSVLMISIGFAIPLGTDPDQCHNAITPNDMFSSDECAWGGAFLVAGGLSASSWIFIRALSMNLQICWDIVPGRKFFYISQAAGWGIPAVFFTSAMTLTGVSFRFGNVCLLNGDHSIANVWGPLLVAAGAAGLVQLTTFAYCIRVYLRNIFADQAESSTNGSNTGLPSYASSVPTQTARAVWRRLQKVLWLQWRGICIVCIILVDVIFFSIVFFRLNAISSSLRKDVAQLRPWLECLALHPTDSAACLPLVQDYITHESTVVAVLFLLALTGIQVFVFLTRPSVFPAWLQFFRAKFSSRSEFVSLDAKPDKLRGQSKEGVVNYTRGHDSTTFEMQSPSPFSGGRLPHGLDTRVISPALTDVSTPEKTYHSPLQQHRNSLIGKGNISEGDRSYVSPDLGINGRRSPMLSPGSPPTPQVRYDAISMHRQNSDYFHFSQRAPERGPRRAPSPAMAEQRRYQPVTNVILDSDGGSRQAGSHEVSFDIQDLYGRGGLALNPPSEVGEQLEHATRYRRYES